MEGFDCAAEAEKKKDPQANTRKSWKKSFNPAY